MEITSTPGLPARASVMTFCRTISERARQTSTLMPYLFLNGSIS